MSKVPPSHQRAGYASDVTCKEWEAMNVKKGYLLVLAAAIVLMFAIGAQPAFALHSGFAANTTDCRSCHAPHGTTGSYLFIQGSKTSTSSVNTTNPLTYVSETLSPTSQAVDMCIYCHVAGTTHGVYQFGINKAGVAASVLATAATAMHELGATTVPDASSATHGISASGLNCIDCHNAMPHDAKDLGVKWNGKAIYSQDASVDAFCSRCHDNNGEGMAQTHPVGAGITAANSTVNTTNYGAVQVAFADATDCSSCHLASDMHFGIASDTLGTFGKSSLLTATNGGKNYFYAGKAFTTFGTGLNYKGQATTTLADGECLSCHQNAAASATAGVGITY